MRPLAPTERVKNRAKDLLQEWNFHSHRKSSGKTKLLLDAAKAPALKKRNTHVTKRDIGLQDLGEEQSERNEGSGGRHRPRSGGYMNFQTQSTT